ncbi:MAG: penicillin-binding protein 1C [Crocinitomix sp.]|nr:penicillin-binding protein 1C [Crocinitomix sp.]
MGKWFLRFIKRYKYILSALTLTVFFIWFFCLPKTLFDDPTSTVLLDKEGNLLAASIAADGQWRFPYNPTVPEKFEKAIIQFEDRSFQSHWGVSIKGLARAVYQNMSSGEKVSGGSTITMQLMRMSRKGQSRTIWQKVVEIFMATRAEWRYDKSEILALYASNAPMGGNVVGLDAAAWRYFARPADQLSWAETATLAVLPNAPSLMHPGKNRDLLIAKRNRLLDRLYEVDEIDSTTWVLSKLEELPEKPHPIPRIAPHLLTRVIKDGLKGQVVQTSIDISIQERTNSIVQFHHEKLRENEIHNAAVLVMEVETGKVIAYTGNVPNVEAEHSSDVDIIMAPRSTGSIIKPFLYASMLENGSVTPEMVVQDIPTIMSGYSPKNYNLKYDGIVKIDDALSRSLNVPMVRLLTKFGVEKFHYSLQKLGFTTIKNTPQHYGLSLILGGAETNLWDLVSAYGLMARSLNRYPNYGTGVNKRTSYLLAEEEYIEERPVFSAATSWFTFQAMREVQRPEDDINWELFETSQQIAWKTGTSFGFRDAWAVGTNSKYVVGVWVGNADGEGRPGLIGRETAAPILFDVFSALPQSDWFYQPFDDMQLVEICSKSGYRASDACEQTQEKYIPKKALNTPPCHYHQFLFLDSSSTYQVNSSCYNMALAKKESWFTLPAVAEYFYKNHDPNYRKPPAYMEGCVNTVGQKELAVIYPKSNSQIFIPLNFEEVNEAIFFEATHINEKINLYWHLDDSFIGTTKGIHQMKYMPATGKHRLTIIDEKGNSEMVLFEVTVSGDG